MKKILVFLSPVILLIGPFLYSQNKTDDNAVKTQKKSFFLESGINASLPIHIYMYQSHRLAISSNAQRRKKISKKGESGIRFDYDY